jgi:hypothetical protein
MRPLNQTATGNGAVTLWFDGQHCGRAVPAQRRWAPAHMKKIAIMFLAVFAAALAMAADTTNVTAIIKGKPVNFSPDVRTQVVQKSVALLASCAYVNAKPKWGAAATEPRSMADAQKQSHLHLVFSSPHNVEVPIEKVTLRVYEMVISLPLVTAGIWVRTDDGVMYFAMFDHIASEDLQKLLVKAQRP